MADATRDISSFRLTLFLIVSSLGDMPCDDDSVRVGATVKALREAHGWALTKFATAIGMSHGHLANIESGRKRLTAEKARRVADTLNVPLAAIITPFSVDDVVA